ncbi:MAG TPA: type II toxin-antitoxin system HipA family toxin [Leucothrix sp.]|nr:type II toxin-antitoxin system HipA family toxin [Leucothrix sp.]
MKTLFVFYNDIQVGHLRVEDNHQYSFLYHKSWVESDLAFSLSCSLPLPEVEKADIALPHDVSYSFFSNLIPEGDLRDKLAMQLGVSEKNDFGLLEVVGGDVAGAISLYPSADLPENIKNTKHRAKSLNEADLLFVLDKLKTHPFLVNTEEFNNGEQLRLSLAGAQNKLPIIFDDEQGFSLPLGKTASTHILKPDNEHITGLVINEAFCMKLAKACGLPTAEVQLIQVKEQIILLVKRYDRENGQRLHQEDFCQALGIVPFNKYESEGGPGFADCRTIIDQYSQRPAADKKTLLQWTLFNYLIGNADAHGKNISLLYQPTPKLAPFYDLICTAIYPSLTDRLSMKIGGENRPEWIMQRHWLRYGETLGVSEKMLKREADKLIKNIKREANNLQQTDLFANVTDKPLSAILTLIEKRSAWLLKRLSEEL